MVVGLGQRSPFCVAKIVFLNQNLACVSERKSLGAYARKASICSPTLSPNLPTSGHPPEFHKGEHLEAAARAFMLIRENDNNKHLRRKISLRFIMFHITAVALIVQRPVQLKILSQVDACEIYTGNYH